MNVRLFLDQLWFTDKETDIFLSLYKLGTVPASTVAKQLGVERTGVYKTLLHMAKIGIVSQTKKNEWNTFLSPTPVS